VRLMSFNRNQTALEVFVSMHSGEETPQDELDFADWCENNPAQVKRYHELEDLWQELALQNMTLSPEEVEEYLPMAALREIGPGSRRIGPKLLHKPAFAAAATLAIAALVLYWLQPFSGITPVQYETKRGERLVVNLSDNSTVNLNALTTIEVRYDTQARLVILHRGEATFEVAHDSARVFTVRTRNSVIEATGTMFNVEANDDEVTLTVLEGSVVVSAKEAENDRAGIPFTVGQQGIVDQSGNIRQKTAENLEKITAWHRGQIIFSGEPLVEAVEKVNRSSTHNIVVADKQIQEFPIYGVFNTGDSQSFVKAVKVVHPIHSLEESEQETVLYFRAKEDD